MQINKYINLNDKFQVRALFAHHFIEGARSVCFSQNRVDEVVLSICNLNSVTRALIPCHFLSGIYVLCVQVSCCLRRCSSLNSPELEH